MLRRLVLVAAALAAAAGVVAVSSAAEPPQDAVRFPAGFGSPIYVGDREVWAGASTSSTSTTSTVASPTTSTPSPTTTTPPSSTPSSSTTPSSTTVRSTSTTSTTSTTSPPVAGLNCAAKPSSCGYPDATNTGVLPGASLRRVPQEVTSGSGWAYEPNFQRVRITGANAVLDGLDITVPVVIDAPNAVIQNSRISACGGSSDGDVIAVRYRSPDYLGAGAQIVGNTLDGSPAGCTHRARSAVRDVYGGAPGMVVDGNDISGVGNGITAEYEATVVDNWIHDLGHLAGDHHSGISSHGGAKDLVWRHNTVLLYGQQFPGGGGVSGALTVYADFGHAQNVLAEDNLISGGSYTVYGGNSGDSYSTPSTNVRFVDNRFVCGAWLYGPVAAFNKSSTGNAWAGNVCDQTGASVAA